MGGCFSLEDRRLHRSASANPANAAATSAANPVVATVENGIETHTVVQPGGISDSEHIPRENLPPVSAANQLTNPAPTNPPHDAAQSLKPLVSNSFPPGTVSTEEAGSSSGNIRAVSASSIAADGGITLKCEPLRWNSTDPMTESQLRRKRETFWDTAPTYEGRPEIWAALRAAAEAFEAEDFALAQAVVNGAGIQLGLGGVLSESWDERGSYYHIPLYCLAAPTNLSAADNFSSLSPSASSNVSLSTAGERRNSKDDHPVDLFANNGKIVPEHAAAVDEENVPDNTYDADNMLNVRLRFHYVLIPPTLHAEEAERSNNKRSNSRNSNHSTADSHLTATKPAMHATAVRKSENSTLNVEKAVDDASIAFPTSSTSPAPSIPVKDMKFPVSLLELVGAAKKRARDKFLSTLLPGPSDWRVQHWFFAGRLLNDKQPLNSLCLLKSNFVIQVIIRERDLKHFQQNHHHNHHHNKHSTKRGSAAVKPSENTSEKPHTSFFSRLSGSSSRSNAAVTAASATPLGSSLSTSRPLTPAAPQTDVAVVERLHTSFSSTGKTRHKTKHNSGAEDIGGDSAVMPTGESSAKHETAVNSTVQPDHETNGAVVSSPLPVGGAGAVRSTTPQNEGSGDMG